MQSLDLLAEKYVGKECTLAVGSTGKDMPAIIRHGDGPRFAYVTTYPSGIQFCWHWDAVDLIMTHKNGRFVA